MQGIVIDNKGAYVKAAIVTVFKEMTEETEDEAITYDETDENGRFLIQDLNPDDKYVIEVYVARPEPAKKHELAFVEAGKNEEESVMSDDMTPPQPMVLGEAEPVLVAAEPVWDNGIQYFDVLSDDFDFDEEDNEFSDEYEFSKETFIVDSLMGIRRSVSAGNQTIITKNLYDMPSLEDKKYLTRTNLW